MAGGGVAWKNGFFQDFIFPATAAAGFGVWANGPERALRGGSWNNNDQNTRAAYRNNNNPNNRNNNVGFRVVEPLSTGDRKCAVSTEASPRIERSTLEPPVSLHTGRASARACYRPMPRPLVGASRRLAGHSCRINKPGFEAKPGSNWPLGHRLRNRYIIKSPAPALLHRSPPGSDGAG